MVQAIFDEISDHEGDFSASDSDLDYIEESGDSIDGEDHLNATADDVSQKNVASIDSTSGNNKKGGGKRTKRPQTKLQWLGGYRKRTLLHVLCYQNIEIQHRSR